MNKKVVALVSCYGLCAVMWTVTTPTRQASAVELFVANTGDDTNAGTSTAPLARIQTALTRAAAGDTITILDGTYAETLDTRRGGASESQRIVVRAANPRKVVVTHSGRVLDVFHPYITFEGLVFDGQFGSSDIIRVRTSGDHLIFHDNVVRDGRRDGIDLGSNSTSVGPSTDFLNGVVIENSKFQSLLWIDNAGQIQDAHGIVAGGVRDFVVRDTEVFHVSGDALQLQDGGWDNVLVDSVKFWNGPLPADVAGFSAGTNPGEDGIDTKQDNNIDVRGQLTVRDSEFYGWRGVATGIPAALNLKENISALIDGNTIYGNDVGIRLRGPAANPGALVTVQNNVFYDHLHNGAFRNGSGAALSFDLLVEDLKVWNNTFGIDNALFFAERGGGPGTGLVVWNNLFLSDETPTYAEHSSNLAVSESTFANALNGDYRLTPNSPAIDAGIAIAGVITDRVGVLRPQGRGPDVGAFEATFVAVPEPRTFSTTLPIFWAIILLTTRRRCRTRRARKGGRRWPRQGERQAPQVGPSKGKGKRQAVNARCSRRLPPRASWILS